MEYPKKEIKLMPTKNGKGYKVVLNGEWFYTSAGEFNKMLGRMTNACVFRTIVDKPVVLPEMATATPAVTIEEVRAE